MRLLMLAALLMTWSSQPPAATTPPPTSAEPPETLKHGYDPGRRMTLPISVAGRGPYRFVVDTGAERTVLSRELAAELDLPAGGSISLATVTEVARVPTVIVPGLEVGRRSVGQLRAPVLAAQHLGAHGLLGLDSLQNLRVDFDFDKGEMQISRVPIRTRSDNGSFRTRNNDNAIVVTGRSLLGRMIVTDADVDGERVRVVVDTGSDVTVGNLALRDRLARRERRPSDAIEVTSVTGGRLQMNYTRTSLVRIGGARFSNLPIAFADLRLFQELGLQDRPAILLGMDALEMFRQVSIDFTTRRLRLVPRPRSDLHAPVRLAAR